jgi:predicted nucleotidyltransferase
MNKTILEAVVGSTVHGTNVQDGLEDLDLMAVILEDRKNFIGFGAQDTWVKRTKPEGVRSEAGDTDWVGYGLHKYLSLALKGNPSVLLPLFAPETHVREMTIEGAMLRKLAPSIVSKRVYMPFRGYMKQQHERLLGTRGQKRTTRPELVEAYGYDTKYAAHVIRLGFQGIELLDTGRLSLPMPEPYRRICVDTRNGKYTLDEVSDTIARLERQLEGAHLSSSLPNEPDTDKVERWMMDIYLAHWYIEMIPGNPDNQL